MSCLFCPTQEKRGRSHVLFYSCTVFTISRALACSGSQWSSLTLFGRGWLFFFFFFLVFFRLARSRLTWAEDFHTGMNCSMETGQFRWFEGGKLNVSVNCVDRCFLSHKTQLREKISRWAAEDPDRVALIWEKDQPGEAERVTYGQLMEMVGRKGQRALRS